MASWLAKAAAGWAEHIESHLLLLRFELIGPPLVASGVKLCPAVGRRIAARCSEVARAARRLACLWMTHSFRWARCKRTIVSPGAVLCHCVLFRYRVHHWLARNANAAGQDKQVHQGVGALPQVQAARDLHGGACTRRVPAEGLSRSALHKKRASPLSRAGGAHVNKA